MDIESLFKNSEIKSWIKGALIVIVGLFVIREIVAGFVFHEITSSMKESINAQRQSIISEQEDSKREIQKIEDGMRREMQAMDEGRKEMSSDIQNMKEDFSKGSKEVQNNLNSAFNEIEDQHNYAVAVISKDAEEASKQHQREFEASFNHSKNNNK